MTKLLLLLVTLLAFSPMLHAKTDLSALSRTFALESGFSEFPSVELSLGQSWLEKEQENFRPGHVALYPRKRGLAVIASLKDEDIYSDATTMNQPMWQLGDVFEIFIGAPEQQAYWELHVTPNNHRLQLIWTPQAFISFRNGDSTLADQAIPNTDFLTSVTRINRTENYWQVYIFLPWTSIDLPDLDDLHTVELAFCRYDSGLAGQPPTLSSTAPFNKINFHLREQWNRISLSSSDK